MTKIISTALLTSAILFGGHFAIVAAEEATQSTERADKEAAVESVRAAKEAATELRTSKREEALTKSRRYAGKVIDRFIRELTALKTKIQNSTLDATLRASIIAQIETRISRLTALKTNISSVATIDAIKDALKEAKDEAVAVRVLKQRYTAQLLIHRFDNIFEKLESAATKLGTRISTLKESGKDVAELESILNQAKSKIADAKTKLAEAKVKYDTLTPTSVKDVNDAASSARTLVKEAIALTRDAHKLLQSLVPKLRALDDGTPEGTNE
jgi:flagellin-like hook-associated protein FlgL